MSGTPLSLSLPEVLGHDEVAPLLDELTSAIAASAQNGSQVQVNAAALRRFDSSAVALLLELRRQTLTRGGTLQVLGQPERLRELLSLYGVGELLPA